MKKKKIYKRKRNEEFFKIVYSIVKRIPYGKVTTYGHIADACGKKSAARTVGWALNGTGEPGLPCHRVVNRYGALTGKVYFGDPDLMEDLLRSEGVEFDEDGNVKLDKYLWIPKKR
jgi:methylated-DNA-protein-cysteine methyltransferase-like protein